MAYVDYLVPSVPWKQASGPWLKGVFRPDKWATEVVLRRFGERKAKADQRPDGNELEAGNWAQDGAERVRV